MSAEADYINAESRNILKTVELMEALLAKESLPTYETIALGKLLQDIYTGIERILRSMLQISCEESPVLASCPNVAAFKRGVRA